MGDREITSQIAIPIQKNNLNLLSRVGRTAFGLFLRPMGHRRRRQLWAPPAVDWHFSVGASTLLAPTNSRDTSDLSHCSS